MRELDIAKVEKACDGIRAILSELKPNRAEVVNILAHSVLECGISIYHGEGGEWESKAQGFNADEAIKRIAQEQKDQPSIGKVLILYSSVLKEMYVQYLGFYYGGRDGEPTHSGSEVRSSTECSGTQTMDQ